MRVCEGSWASDEGGEWEGEVERPPHSGRKTGREVMR